MPPPPPPGSTTLVIRLSSCPTDSEAWTLFVHRYSPTIYDWSRNYRLQDADACDVTQNVFAILLSRLHTFDRARGSFRNWLYRVVQHAVYNWCKDPDHRLERGTEVVRRLLASEQARCDLEARLNEQFDLERLEVAEKNVRLFVKPHCWESYRLRCKEKLNLREAANQLGIPIGHVSKYALRVQDMITKHLSLLED